MSDPVKIGLVSEGITDYLVLRAAIESMLEGRSFILTSLQPEGSVAFTGRGQSGPFGGGWKGVYKWCLQSAKRGSGSLSGDPLFVFGYDLLVLHLDADVAGEDPSHDPVAPMPDLAGLLPREQACPPPNATTDQLRVVMLSWLGETQTPPQTVLGTPSKNTEAWVMAACFPSDEVVNTATWECRRRPENRLGLQPRAKRFSKSYADYEARQSELQARWPAIVAGLSEAPRFENDFTTAIQTLPAP
jgi:hypothetical protein